MSKTRVLLIGWDAADWKIIRPLLEAGEMPFLARLMSEGVHGNLATIYPVLSPMLWTSIATGKRPYKHGIHGFCEPMPSGMGVRPITTLSRRSKAIWNILHQHGQRSIVVGWWPSHPAEPINGVMVSNHYPQVKPARGRLPPLLSGTIHPRQRSAGLADLRVNPMELTGDFIRLFVPDYHRVDQEKDKRLHSLSRIIAETMSIHAVATELLETESWDFAAIYYTGIDHFGHGFMGYHPPRLPWTKEEDFEIYHPVIANAYRYHDAMLGRLLEMTDDHTTVILMSDHGFHSDHLRPGYIPAEPAGPAVEHRHFGIFCMRGPHVRRNQQVHGACVLDVCPTILSLYGLAAGQDMDGKVLATAFEEVPSVEPIASWDAVEGDAGTHPPDARLDPVASAEAFQQLVELGYVEPPGEDATETVDRSVRELKYNLARAYVDGSRSADALPLARELWERWQDEHRFGLLVIDCLEATRQLEERRQAIQELDRRLVRYRKQAHAELKQRRDARETVSDDGKASPAAGDKREQFERRRLSELAMERTHLVATLWLRQAILEGDLVEARRLLESFEQQDAVPMALRHQLTEALIQLGDLEEARRLLTVTLEIDPESPQAHAQQAVLHFKAGRHDEAIAAVTESLGLLYFQPSMHALLGRALMAKGCHADAEKALLVALAQNNRTIAAHEALGKLYREHLGQPDKAFAHEGRAMSLRHRVNAHRRGEQTMNATPQETPPPGEALAADPAAEAASDPLVAPFSADIDPAKVITVVSGLPRSGTSLMMQLLVASGRQALTDGQREADESNPLGYLEFEPATRLRRDREWIPQARGKVVKVVAQLLPFLPEDEHYNIVFMNRELKEVIDSQRSMLERLNRPGQEINAATLEETYRVQLRRVWTQLRRREGVRLLSVRFTDLLLEPGSSVARLAAFFGDPFDQAGAVRAVKPDLWRHKS